MLTGPAWPKTYYVAPPPEGSDSNNGTGGWSQAYATIANAVSKATNYDEILVTNGTYVFSAQLSITKPLAIRSVNGPGETFIDGNGAVGCIYINVSTYGTSTNNLIEGFTIRNGSNTSSGAAVRIDRAGGGWVNNCILVSNIGYYAFQAGSSFATTGFTMITDTRILDNPKGGIIVTRDDVVVRHCTIDGTTGQVGLYVGAPATATNRLVERCTIMNCSNSSFGAGIYLSGPALFTNCLVANNIATRGAGVYGNSGPGQFWDCTLASNRTTTGEGGGVYSTTTCEANFSNCRLIGNSSGISGGGLYLTAQSTLSRCWILGNVATRHGGGLYDVSRATLHDCLVAGNSAGTNSGDRGGGVHIASSLTGEYWNCTIASNVAPAATGYGGGLWFGGTAHLVNSIVYDNSAGQGSSNWYRNSGTLLVTNSCMAPASGTGISGENITGEDPRFADPGSGNFRLGDGSPCVNAGLTMDWMADALDLDGRARLDRFTRQVDMGAYERPMAGTLFRLQ